MFSVVKNGSVTYQFLHTSNKIFPLLINFSIHRIKYFLFWPHNKYLFACKYEKWNFSDNYIYTYNWNITYIPIYEMYVTFYCAMVRITITTNLVVLTSAPTGWVSCRLSFNSFNSTSWSLTLKAPVNDERLKVIRTKERTKTSDTY